MSGDTRRAVSKPGTGPAPLVIRGGRVIDPSQGLDRTLDVLLEDGHVARLGEAVKAPKGTEVMDGSDLVVCPGLIDIHVHLREPGQEHKETVRTGTLAAAAGGFTAVACMANTVPVNDNASVTELILAQAERAGYARVYPVGAVSKGMRGDELAEVGEMIAAGAVAISDDGLPVAHPELLRRAFLYAGPELLRRAFLYAGHFGIPLLQHAEDLSLTGDGVMHEGEWSTRLGLPGIPGAAEDLMVARDLMLAGDTGGRYHVQHVSTARSLELIRSARARGVDVTCEVTPHHLFLTDRGVADSGFSTDYKMKPPLRSEADRQALLRGIADGSVDCIASDHAPHHPDEKDVEFSLAPFGILGLETTLSLCLHHLVHGGVIGLPRLVELLSTSPARVLGVPGGTLAEGSPGDVTLLDPNAEVTVDRARFRSRSRNTPFHGQTLRGRPVATVVGGRKVDLP